MSTSETDANIGFYAHISVLGWKETPEWTYIYNLLSSTPDFEAAFTEFNIRS